MRGDAPRAPRLKAPKQAPVYQWPIEVRAGVGLAAWRDFAVAYYGAAVDAGIAGNQGVEDARENAVLAARVAFVVGAFEFDADGKVVATGAAAPARDAGVPRAAIKGDELRDAAGATHEEVGGDADPREVGQAWIAGAVQGVAEQPRDRAGAEFARGQRNAVDDHQAYVLGIGPGVLIRRPHAAGLRQPMIGAYNHSAIIRKRHSMQHHPQPPPPSPAIIAANVRAALAEDVGDGDVTAELVGRDAQARAVVVSRSRGVFCGAPWVVETCRQVDPDIRVDRIARDGAELTPGGPVMEFSGAARSLLTAERTILNFAQLLSGTATRARAYAQAVVGTKAQVLDTRKTIPGLRAAQKYAAAVGGVRNHRAGLFDAYLIKENHIAAAGGIAVAVRRARDARPDLIVEIEVENMDQFGEALRAGPDIVLLDNFSLEETAKAVRSNGGRIKIEVSGGIRLDDVAAIARRGVDYISVGDITKHVEPADFSMRFS